MTTYTIHQHSIFDYTYFLTNIINDQYNIYAIKINRQSNQIQNQIKKLL